MCWLICWLLIFLRVYLSSPNSADTAQACPLTLLSYPEETKDCVACNVKATSVPKPAIQAFKLFNESPQVQVVVNLCFFFFFVHVFKYL